MPIVIFYSVIMRNFAVRTGLYRSKKWPRNEGRVRSYRWAIWPKSSKNGYIATTLLSKQLPVKEDGLGINVGRRRLMNIVRVRSSRSGKQRATRDNRATEPPFIKFTWHIRQRSTQMASFAELGFPCSYVRPFGIWYSSKRPKDMTGCKTDFLQLSCMSVSISRRLVLNSILTIYPGRVRSDCQVLARVASTRVWNPSKGDIASPGF